ncbi:MAG: hypothetical protein KME16_15085 [Scytolyngbya sp. HA4215-MV1]|nr:hypothetical protein [Scytolyngbya sp. HA4215-MV1]
MSEEPKVPDAKEPEVIRQPIVPEVETETADGPRSPRNDRDPGVINLVEKVDESEAISQPAIRKPIVIDAPTDP